MGYKKTDYNERKSEQGQRNKRNGKGQETYSRKGKNKKQWR